MKEETITNQDEPTNPSLEQVGCDALLTQKIGELEFKEVEINQYFKTQKLDALSAHHAEWGSITVLDRMTGFGWRDVETGFKDPDGRFWLASGNFSIRMFPDLTVKEAIAKIKENANTCQG